MIRKLDDSSRVFFSVVVCTYNRAGILPRALNSLLRQSCKDWECIIIDDDSTDDTEKAISSYLTKDKVRYFRHSHRGCAMSKNAGMKAARGKYITFLDSDDEYQSEHLNVRKKYLEKEPVINLLYSDVTVIGDSYVPDKNDPSKKIAIADCTVGGTFVIKRNTLHADDLFKDIYSDDSTFLQRFISSGRKVKKISSPTYIYHRDSSDSICSSV